MSNHGRISIARRQAIISEVGAMGLSSLYLLSFLVFIAVGVRFVGAGGLSKNLVNPGYVFVIAYSLGYFFLPIISLYTGVSRYGYAYSLDAHLSAMLYSLLFGVIVFVTYRLLAAPNAYRRWQRLLSIKIKPLWRFQAWLVLLLCWMLVGVGLTPFVKLISIHGVAEYAANRIVLGAGLGYYKLLLTSGLVSFAILFADWLLRKSAPPVYCDLPLQLAFGLAIVPGIVLVSRTRLLLPVVIAVILWLVIKKRGRLLPRQCAVALLFASLVLLVGIVLGPMRESLMANEHVEIDMPDVSARLISSYSVQENLLWLFDNPQPLLLGKTFAAIVVGWIPREIWSDKPLGGGPYLRNMIVPGSYDLEHGKNLTSYTTGLPAESFMNFGWLGLCVAPLLGGVLVLLVKALTLVGRPVIAAFVAIVLFQVQYLPFSEMFGWASHVLSVAVPVVGIWITIEISRLSGSGYREKVGFHGQ